MQFTSTFKICQIYETMKSININFNYLTHVQKDGPMNLLSPKMDAQMDNRSLTDETDRASKRDSK